MKRHLSLFLLLILAGTGAWAQGKISGKLTDTEGAGLPYATVALLNTADSSLAKGAITNEEGAYELVGIKAGNYILQARMMGYAGYLSSPMAIEENQAKQIPTITLASAEEQLEAVEVRGQLPQIVQEADRMVVNVENSSLSAGGNALEVLEKSPGILVDQDGNISMNGKQGVIIMIDGKRTFLSATEVSNMLRNMSSEAVSKIELITNPGAKYDAEGNAGIINIQTKKKLAGGTNGTLTAGAGYGRYEKANGGLSLNHRNGRLNLFGNYNYNYNNTYRETFIDRKAPYNGQIVYFDQDNLRPQSFNNNSFKAGADYFLSDKTTLGVAVNGFTSVRRATADNFTNIDNLEREQVGYIYTGLRGKATSSNLTYNLNWQQKLRKEGEEILFNADYTRYRSQDNDIFNIDQEDDVINQYASYYVRNRPESDIDIYVSSLDYTLPLANNNRLELGAKSSYVTSNNQLLLEESPAGELWKINEQLSSNFLYRENLNALYANWSGKVGKLQVTAGLRAEHTWYNGDADTTQISDNYVSLFPSIFVQHQISEKQHLGASYSRRVDRPSYQDLNPFFYFLDLFTYGKGNPLLQPSFTNQMQFTHGYNNWLNTSLTLSHTKNPMTDIIDQDDENGATYQTNTNLGDLYAWNLNVNASLQPLKWWSMQNNFSLYQNIFDARFRGQELDTDVLAWNYNLQNSFVLPANFKAELGAFYRSPSQFNTIDIKSMYAVFAGVSKSFMDDRASLKLNINDIFNTMRFRGSIQFDNIDADVINQWESRQARLTFTYRFGSNDMKAVQRRRGASSDEQSRIKSGS
jgi:hypothetical protein